MVGSWSIHSPHWTGLWISIALLVIAVVWIRFGAAGPRLRLLWVLAALPVLGAVALFGSGDVTVQVDVYKHLRNDTPLARLDDPARDAVIAEATDPRYLTYVTRREAAKGEPLDCSWPMLGGLEHHVISYDDAHQRGLSISPRPPRTDPILAVRYRESVNAGARLLDLKDHSDCDSYVQTVFYRDVQVLSALSLVLRGSQAEELFGLKYLRSASLTAPEWALERLPAEMSTDALNEELQRTRAVLQKAIDEPERRGMPSGTEVELPAA